VLEEFLNNKPLFYDEIDYTRMPRVYERIQQYFSLPKIIHIIGTNGKGTTGRFLSTALYRLGYNTGHYTSPHILEFNERIWFNGNNVSMQLLEETHENLLTILTPEEVDSLSYFEYTTFLAMLFFSKKSDFIILEAGLGGEYDATAVFDNHLTLVTPIDKDHEAFLGDSIYAIAKTKLAAIQKVAISVNQKYNDVNKVLEEIQQNKTIELFRVEELLDTSSLEKINLIAKHDTLAPYLKENLSLAIAALQYFHIEYTPEIFYNARLFGRLTQLEKNIIVDVGHNPLAAKSIVRSLKGSKYILVYNSYKDKNYKEILKILKPIIKEVHLIDIENVRVAKNTYLQKSLEELGISYSDFNFIDSNEEYLVFGSFSVVETFLKVYHG